MAAWLRGKVSTLVLAMNRFGSVWVWFGRHCNRTDIGITGIGWEAQGKTGKHNSTYHQQSARYVNEPFTSRILNFLKRFKGSNRKHVLLNSHRRLTSFPRAMLHFFLRSNAKSIHDATRKSSLGLQSMFHVHCSLIVQRVGWKTSRATVCYSVALITPRGAARRRKALVHRCSSWFIVVHRCSSWFIVVHRCSSLFTRLPREAKFLLEAWQSCGS